MSIQLEISGNGFALRWMLWDYEKVLQIFDRLLKLKGE